MEIAAPDQRHVGFDPAEGVGFVHKAGGQNARHGSSPQLQRRQLRELLARLRQKLGSRTPIIVTLDLHANVTRNMADNANALIALSHLPAPCRLA
jgi:hypothetical protein